MNSDEALVSNWSTDSWHTLTDPDFKLGPNDLGSGQLHRRGKNFIPISEEHVLANRLGSKKKLPKKESKHSNVNSHREEKTMASWMHWIDFDLPRPQEEKLEERKIVSHPKKRVEWLMNSGDSAKKWAMFDAAQEKEERKMPVESAMDWNASHLGGWGQQVELGFTGYSQKPVERFDVDNYKIESFNQKKEKSSYQRSRQRSSQNKRKPIQQQQQDPQWRTNKLREKKPVENKVLITVHVELSDNLKVSVKIKELDDPRELARDFAQKNNINTPNIIQALTDLFESQKTAAQKKKR
ncbi:hypothetical protein G6F56_004262 [Rhizopus delemar]|uniref:Uncharacterized protein n=1 Tax=Rhizopus stolonifer TaxID=4846 RepID=A0A367JAY3_RHIST|nr:hypothetical protein G6F56_004262 [Rhizopus delemar]RCH87112.1 hypothetical protein CU098_001956 [Rhizopus stolonifer]